jgi:hypothetical protein
MIKKYGIYILLFFYLLAGIFTIFHFNGTGDAGDSVLHYLFAKYAPQHPELYFNHWAKPLFVLLASPFSQFGFAGVKFFNLLVSLFAIFFTYKTARLLNLPNALLSALLFICAPLNFLLTFSGLTEPLFALVLILGLYFTLQGRSITGAALLSFLPFVRSEGLLFLGVFGFWYLISRNWKAIPFLLVGHLVYSVAGYFVYHDFLWIFTKIPYSTLKSNYGSGPLDHFVKQLNFVLGIPIYVLLWVGILSFIADWFRKRLRLFSAESILILGGFLAFFVAHTLFWYLGIFHSAGLKRVFIGVLPLSALVCLIGLNFLLNFLPPNPKIKNTILSLLTAILLLFPFTRNRAAMNWQEMSLNRNQELANQTAAFLRQFPTVSGAKFFYAHPYLSVSLGLDHFDSQQHLNLTMDDLKNLKKGDIVIWENWFAVVENHLPQEQLEQIPGLVKLKEVSGQDEKETIRYVIFQYQ